MVENYPGAWIERGRSMAATSYLVYSEQRKKVSTEALIFIQPRILCHGQRLVSYPEKSWIPKYM